MRAGSAAALFQTGAYVSLDATGRHRDSAFAFARTSQDDLAVAVVPRLVTALTSDGAPPVGARVWGNTRVDLGALGEPRTLYNLFTGEAVPPAAGTTHWSVELARVCATFPVALLVDAHGRAPILTIDAVPTILGAGFLAWFVLVVLFAPGIPYRVETPADVSCDEFVHELEASCGTTLEGGNRIDVLTNGPTFYPAMLDAIRSARETINMECYIFHKGETADRFTEALTERARAGVKVTIVLDMVGSFGSFHSCARLLKDAGCRVERYQPFTWHGLARLNNRTHRELLIVDGRTAFVGGAGVADWWARPLNGKPTWREMMSRIEGPVVTRIQGVFAETGWSAAVKYCSACRATSRSRGPAILLRSRSRARPRIARRCRASCFRRRSRRLSVPCVCRHGTSFPISISAAR